MVVNSRYYIAVTGASGSGKTTVLQMLKKRGFFTKDYDFFSVEIIKDSQAVHSKLFEFIGEKYWKNKNVDLKYVGEYFDKHEEEEKQFEAWYQPYLGERIRKDILENGYQGICFFDVPFLKEKNIFDLFDEIWIIETEFKLCCKRIQARNGYSDKKAMYLVKRSMPCEKNTFLNTYIIDNNFSEDNLETQLTNRLFSILA